MKIVYYEGCKACDQRKWLNDENTDLEAASPSVIAHTCPLAGKGERIQMVEGL